MDQKCETCRFASGTFNYREHACRRRAPGVEKVESWKDTRLHVPVFPIVTSDGWCGEWEAGRGAALPIPIDPQPIPMVAVLPPKPLPPSFFLALLAVAALLAFSVAIAATVDRAMRCSDGATVHGSSPAEARYG